MINSESMANPPVNPAQDIEKERESREEKEQHVRATLSATSGIFFVVLPFIVIGITLAHRGELRTILFIPEWSIVSAVIIGQAIVKLAYIGLTKESIRKEPIVLFISGLLVCFLVPILIVLAITLTSQTMSLGLAITQAIFFVLGVLVFWAASYLERYIHPPRLP
jgi:hypothetical protein